MKKQNVRTLSFIVSTITYLLMGAAIFDALESQTEENHRYLLNRTEIDYKQRYNISNYEYETFEDIVIKYHPYRAFPQWKFVGAFYFSLTVITTIGYGHSTPQTIPGKLFCMFYALIGIPLCLVMFQSVGERLNYFTSFCIQLVKKCIRIKNLDVKQTEMVFVSLAFAIFLIFGGAAMFSYYEEWTYLDSMYYCVITLTTIGFGDFVNKNNLSNTSYVILSFTFILFGMTVVASAMNLLVLKFLTMNTDDERREEFSRKVQQSQSLAFGSSELLSAVNGMPAMLCNLEHQDLEDLRIENSFLNCFPKRYFPSIIHEKLPYISWRSLVSSAETKQPNEKCLKENPSSECGEINSMPNSHISVTERSNSKKLVCISCYTKRKNRKSHYTIRRGPGKISHLLISQRVESMNVASNKNVESKTPMIFINNESFRSSDAFIDQPDRREENIAKDISVFIDDDNEHEELDLNESNKLNLMTKRGFILDGKTNFLNAYPSITSGNPSASSQRSLLGSHRMNNSNCSSTSQENIKDVGEYERFLGSGGKDRSFNYDEVSSFNDTELDEINNCSFKIIT